MKIRMPYYEEGNNPNQKEVKYIVIQTDSCPPRVAHIYKDVKIDEIVRCSEAFTPMNIRAARELFDFIHISDFYEQKRVENLV